MSSVPEFSSKRGMGFINSECGLQSAKSFSSSASTNDLLAKSQWDSSRSLQTSNGAASTDNICMDRDYMKRDLAHRNTLTADVGIVPGLTKQDDFRSPYKPSVKVASKGQGDKGEVIECLQTTHYRYTKGASGSAEQQNHWPFSFNSKGLKTRRADQNAYRRDLDRQIEHKRLLREQESQQLKKISQGQHSQSTKSIKENSNSDKIPWLSCDGDVNRQQQENDIPSHQLSVNSDSPLPVQQTYYIPNICQNTNGVVQATQNPVYFVTPGNPAINTGVQMGVRQQNILPINIQQVHGGQVQGQDVQANLYYQSVMPLISQQQQLPYQQMPTVEVGESSRANDETNCRHNFNDENCRNVNGTQQECADYKPHISDYSEQRQDGADARTKLRDVLDQQMKEKEQLEKERKAREIEQERMLQRKIKMDQEKMQKEHQEELRQRAEKEAVKRKRQELASKRDKEVRKEAEARKQRQQEERRKALKAKAEERDEYESCNLNFSDHTADENVVPQKQMEDLYDDRQLPRFREASTQSSESTSQESLCICCSVTRADPTSPAIMNSVSDDFQVEPLFLGFTNALATESERMQKLLHSLPKH